MKTTIALTLSFIPLLLTAQRNSRCSCMDRHTTSFGPDLAEVVQKVNSHPANIQQQLNMLYQVQAVTFQQEDHPAAQPPEKIQKENIPAEAKVEETMEEKSVEEKSSTRVQRSRMKKKIRRKRVRLKPARKARKYKGGCPVFND